MLWKDVVGYEGLYQVSNNGMVKSLPRRDKLGRLKYGVIKSQIIQNSGYAIVNFKVDSEQKNYLVHRLVSTAFIPNPENLPCVNHIDGNKQNNNVTNLEWCSYSDNMKHANEHNLTNIVNRKIVKISIGEYFIMFKSQTQLSNYLGFTDGWCYQRILRNGNPFNYRNLVVEVIER